MVKLRLTRVGRHKRAYFRLVATDSRTKVNGGYIELLGNYDPIANDIRLFDDKIINWLSQGAQPSDTVKTILREQGIWAKFVATKPTAAPKKPGTAKPKKASSKSTTKAVKKPAAKPASKPAAKPAVKKTTTK